jgi:trigger factor
MRRCPPIPEPLISARSLERLVVKADDAAVTRRWRTWPSRQNFEDRKKGAKAKDGDQVVIDFKGSVDGELFEGGAAEDYPAGAGVGVVHPGLRGSAGRRQGRRRGTVNVTFPEEYGAAHLAGKAAVFACTVKAVKEPKAAEIDDELAKKYGAEDLDRAEGPDRRASGGRIQGRARAVLKRALLDSWTAVSSSTCRRAWSRPRPGRSPTSCGTRAPRGARPQPRREIEPTDEHKQAGRAPRAPGPAAGRDRPQGRGQVTDAEMTQAVLAQARQYPGQERQFFEFVQKNPQMQQQLRAPIFEDKVVDRSPPPRKAVARGAARAVRHSHARPASAHAGRGAFFRASVSEPARSRGRRGTPATRQAVRCAHNLPRLGPGLRPARRSKHGRRRRAHGIGQEASARAMISFWMSEVPS